MNTDKKKIKKLESMRVEASALMRRAGALKDMALLAKCAGLYEAIYKRIHNLNRG